MCVYLRMYRVATYVHVPTYLTPSGRTFWVCVSEGWLQHLSPLALALRLESCTSFDVPTWAASEGRASERATAGGSRALVCARDAGAAVVVAGPTRGECRREIVTLADEAAWEALAHASLVAAIASHRLTDPVPCRHCRCRRTTRSRARARRCRR